MDNLQAGTPRYRQLKEYINKKIDSGEWPADFRIASENELSRKWGVSRMTANRALRELSESGVLYRVQGLGTFVAERKPESSILEIRNIADEIRLRGHRHSSRVLKQEEITADLDVCHHLELPAERRVYHSVIIHFENDVPIQLEKRFVNKDRVPGYLRADFTNITPNVYLTETAPLSEAENVIQAVVPAADAAAALNIPREEPCLLVRRRTWSGGVPVCYALLIHPGSRYRITSRFTV